MSNRTPSERTRREAREIAADLSDSLGCYVWSEDGVVYVDAADYARAVEARKAQTKYGYSPRIRLCPFA
jgi:hypothetical protein